MMVLPQLGKLEKHVPQINIGQPVTYEQYAATQGVGPKLDVQGAFKLKALKIAGLSQNNRLLVVNVAVEFDDLWRMAYRLQQVACGADFYVRLAVVIKGAFQPGVVIGGVDERKVQLANQTMYF